MKPRFFDIHSHINFASFDKDRKKVIERTREESVWAIVVGTDLETSKEVVELAKKNKNIFATVGLHPDKTSGGGFVPSGGGFVPSGGGFVEKFNTGDYKELVKYKKVIAIGECGLDYFRTKTADKEKTIKRQKESFIKQIEFALENNLPLMLHFRPYAKTMDAYEDGLEILNSYKKEYGDKLLGNAHFFAGSLEIAKKFLDIEFTLSFTGVITFADSYNEIIKYAPLNMIMSETDCPFVSPSPHRGKRCESIYVKEVVKKISEIRNEDYEKVREALVNNAFKTFSKLI